MQSYLRFKQGHSFTITKRGQELKLSKSITLPAHLIDYTEYAAKERGLDFSNFLSRVLIEHFERNDLILAELAGNCAIKPIINKTEEYIELFENNRQ